MKKNRLLQTVLVAVFAVCTLFSAFISVLACIPVSTDVEIEETVKAYASRENAWEDTYRIDVAGALKNTTEGDLTVERLEFILEADGVDEPVTVVAENVTIPARNTVTVSKSELANEKFDRVKEVVATVNGETLSLRNPAETSPTAALIPLAVTAVFAYLLVRACKVRYYMMQEDRADTKNA
jgi:multidrug efflux pump subunit AcrA (membrane-fusion protein)